MIRSMVSVLMNLGWYEVVMLILYKRDVCRRFKVLWDNLGKAASHWNNLTYNERKVMLKCLQKYPQAFKGGLGT